jgi:hypothetical protein
MTDSVPADVPLDSQQEAPDASGGASTGESDDVGVKLDERGAAPEPSPANPLSADAGISSADDA